MVALRAAAGPRAVPVRVPHLLRDGRDSCGSGVEPAPRVCSGAYFATIFYSFGFVLLIAAVAEPVMIVKARRRGSRRWLQPVYGMVFLTIGAVAYMALLIQ